MEAWKARIGTDEMKQKFRKLNASGKIPKLLEAKRKELGITKGIVSLDLFRIIFEEEQQEERRKAIQNAKAKLNIGENKEKISDEKHPKIEKSQPKTLKHFFPHGEHGFQFEKK